MLFLAVSSSGWLGLKMVQTVCLIIMRQRYKDKKNIWFGCLMYWTFLLMLKAKATHKYKGMLKAVEECATTKWLSPGNKQLHEAHVLHTVDNFFLPFI